GVVGVIPDVEMIRLAEPRHEVGVNPGRRSLVKKIACWQFAGVFRRRISVRLPHEGIGSTGVVAGLIGEGRGWLKSKRLSKDRSWKQDHDNGNEPASRLHGES